MKKNPSPGRIALLAACLSALLPTFLLVLFTEVWWHFVLLYLASVAASSLLFYYFLQVFIYEKIKLIYKNIYRFKSQDKDMKDILFKPNFDPISEVNREVMSWMTDNRKELNQLKEQAAFRREFLGNVSHELKTPIFSIQGYIHTLLDGALEDKAVNRKFLRRASRSTERLVELVQELTTISELQSGKLELDYERFDIYRLVEEVYEMLEDQAKEHKIALLIDKESSKPFYVKADRNRIHQVLTNLIVNAIKHGNKGGKVEAAFFDLDNNCLIEISDDGEGIDSAHLPRLFERFYRIDKHRSRDVGGSGLGLAIVKHIVEAHQQTINVRSTVGKGSTFGFTLAKG